MMLAPSASSTSALPDFDDTERPPCLATRAPAAAATNIDAVEMLKVCAASPPVPTMSSSGGPGGTSTLVANSRITCAAAAISPTVSFFTRRPTVSAAIITGDDFAAHDPPHQRQHLVGEDLPVLDGALQRFLDGDGHVACSL